MAIHDFGVSGEGYGVGRGGEDTEIRKFLRGRGWKLSTRSIIGNIAEGGRGGGHKLVIKGGEREEGGRIKMRQGILQGSLVKWTIDRGFIINKRWFI